MNCVLTGITLLNLSGFKTYSLSCAQYNSGWCLKWGDEKWYIEYVDIDSANEANGIIVNNIKSSFDALWVMLTMLLFFKATIMYIAGHRTKKQSDHSKPAKILLITNPSSTLLA